MEWRLSHPSSWKENVLGGGNSKCRGSGTGRAWNVWEWAERLVWRQWREHMGAVVCGALKSQESDHTGPHGPREGAWSLGLWEASGFEQGCDII